MNRLFEIGEENKKLNNKKDKMELNIKKLVENEKQLIETINRNRESNETSEKQNKGK